MAVRGLADNAGPMDEANEKKRRGKQWGVSPFKRVSRDDLHHAGLAPGGRIVLIAAAVLVTPGRCLR